MDMAKFKNKYRVESTRLPGWDYAAAGWYFVTMCVKNRQPVFGQILGGEMQLSAIGEIAHQFLVEIPKHFSHAELDAFVVMPNHVHGIVVLGDNEEIPDLTSPGSDSKREFGPLRPGSLSKIIQAYKAAVTRQARRDGFPDFAWQERFYDHIISDDRSLENIRTYILGNPVIWEQDEYYAEM